MSVTHPTREKVEALRRRWEGQEYRLEAVARDLRAGRDWTVHLLGLPLVEEVPPLEGEACGRDLRGANLRRQLRPEVEIRPAAEREAALVAGISIEGLRNNTALPDTSPFPVEVEGAAGIALAMRRDERFLLARCDNEPVGVVRLAVHREFDRFTSDEPYLEVSGLAVLPRWRRTGVGARLLTACEETGRDAGHGWLLLRTTYEVGLVDWYEHRGYMCRHVRQFSYPDAPTTLDVVMTKRILVPTDTGGKRRRRWYRASGACASPTSALFIDFVRPHPRS